MKKVIAKYRPSPKIIKTKKKTELNKDRKEIALRSNLYRVLHLSMMLMSCIKSKDLLL